MLTQDDGRKQIAICHLSLLRWRNKKQNQNIFFQPLNDPKDKTEISETLLCIYKTP